eukprot:TRINITY_DN12390_c0_g1_i1.p1 TRINITY_DN12390_c0_g1~~TRINITY_DN12390_c0_g1_i1.p1  ORF type:complete len:416 (-),score=56.89 TRINITY_DN12390_c0_g1_i1:120-1367(-)
MLVYDNENTVRLLLQIVGSVVFRCRVWALGIVVSLTCLGLQTVREDVIQYLPDFPSYAVVLQGSIVTFAVVFRTNLAWGRYWEAATQLHIMYSKWLDAFIQFDAFACATIQQHLTDSAADAMEKVRMLQKERAVTQRDFVLLSAVSCDRFHKSDLARMSRRVQMKVPWSHQVCFREDLEKYDLVGARALPAFHVDNSEGAANTQDYSDPWNSVYVIPNQPTQAQLKFLEGADDRPAVVLSWLFIGLARVCSVIAVPPPIQSRMYQELSNGMIGFNNVRKIADVPFPLPYAQLVVILLWVWILLIPIYVTLNVSSHVVGPIVGLFMFVGIWCANLLAMELENPLSGDANDVCPLDFHARFVDAVYRVAVSGQATLDGELQDDDVGFLVDTMPPTLHWRGKKISEDTKEISAAVSRV